MNGSWPETIEQILGTTQILFVNAAGNDDNPYSRDQKPSPSTVFVGSVGRDLNLSSFSNHGELITFVAPGEDVKSIVGSERAGRDPIEETKSGTSMAAPQVSAIASIIYSLLPGIDCNSVIKILKWTAIDLGTPGPDAFYGYGLLNAYGAVNLALSLRETKDGKLANDSMSKKAQETREKCIQTFEEAFSDDVVNWNSAKKIQDCARRSFFLDPQSDSARELLLLASTQFGDRDDVLNSFLLKSLSERNIPTIHQEPLNLTDRNPLLPSESITFFKNLILRHPEKLLSEYSNEELINLIDLAILVHETPHVEIELPKLMSLYLDDFERQEGQLNPSDRQREFLIRYATKQQDPLRRHQVAAVLRHAIFPDALFSGFSNEFFDEIFTTILKQGFDGSLGRQDYWILLTNLIRIWTLKEDTTWNEERHRQLVSAVPVTGFFRTLRDTWIIELRTAKKAGVPLDDYFKLRDAEVEREVAPKLMAALEAQPRDVRSWLRLIETHFFSYSIRDIIKKDQDLSQLLLREWHATTADVRRKVLNTTHSELASSDTERLGSSFIQTLAGLGSEETIREIHSWLIDGSIGQFSKAFEALQKSKRLQNSDIQQIVASIRSVIQAGEADKRLRLLTLDLPKLMDEGLINTAFPGEILLLALEPIESVLTDQLHEWAKAGQRIDSK